MELFNVPGVQPAMRSRAGSGGVAEARGVESTMAAREAMADESILPH